MSHDHDDEIIKKLSQLRNSANNKMQIYNNINSEFSRLGDTLDDEDHSRFSLLSLNRLALLRSLLLRMLACHKAGGLWAVNNSDRKHKGATFYFTLPVMDTNRQTRKKKVRERLINDQQ
jgi:hypothetical protein